MSNEDSDNKLPYYVYPEDRIFKTLDEFIKFNDDQNRVHNVIDNGTSIKFAQDSVGKLTVDFGKGPYKFTETGFSGLCKTLKVPSRYLQTLPFENITKDLLVGLNKCNLTRLSFITKSDRFTGLSPREELVSSKEILEKLKTVNLPNMEFKELSYINEETHVSMTIDRIVPLPNEVFDCGIALTHDDSFGLHPELVHYIYRQICSNGAKTKKLTKISGFSQRMTKAKMLDMLPKKIETNVQALNAQIHSALTNMNNMVLKSEDKRYIKMFLTKKLSFADQTDGFAMFDTTIGANDKASYFDLMNFITDFSKKFDETDRKDKIENFGGDIMGFFKGVSPTIEPMAGFNAFKAKQVHKEKVEA